MALQTVTLTSTTATTWTVPTKAYILSEVFLVGGGSGGQNATATYPGGGGAGGRVNLQFNYQVTPGATINYVCGSGGAAAANGSTTTFGPYSAAGGTISATQAYGGSSSRNIGGTTTNTTGGTSLANGTGGSEGGGGGASPGNNGPTAGNPTGGAGAAGYLYQGSFYGGGGGGGGAYFTAGTPRPISGGAGGAGGGGKGGAEGGSSANPFPGTAGSANTGGGGGGGCAGGTSTEKTNTQGQPNPGATNVTKTQSAGAAGGSGVIIVTYDEAEAYLRTSQPGVSDGNSIIVYLYTKNVTNGSVLPYTISTGAGVTAADFNPATLTGSFTVSSTDGGLNGTASVTLTIAADSGVTEGEETVLLSLNNGLGSVSFKIGDLYQNPIAVSPDAPGYLVIGRSYTIVTAGTTIWTDLGSANNTAGTTFTATATGLVTAGNFISGRSYTITYPGNTDFTKLGASSNTVGVTFTATGSGFINATAMTVGQKYTIITLGTTDYTDAGLGWVSVLALTVGEVYTIKSLGTTTQLNWNNIAGTTGITYSVGSTFTAVISLGVGTGYVLPEGFVVTTGQTFTATAVGTGTGTVMPAATLSLATDLGTASQGSGTCTGIWVSKTIQIADYNDIQSKVAGVLGTGSGNSGYGQTVFSNQITTSNRVSVSDWTALKYDIINAYTHQVGTVPTSLVNIAVGDTVKANTATAPYRQYATWADVILTQKFDIASSQSLVRTFPATGGNWYTETTWPGALGATWTGRTYALFNVYWANAASARYFFNSGGEIRFISSRAGGTTTGAIAAQNTSWTTMLNGIGTQAFGGNKPTADTGVLTGGNFYRLNNGLQAWFTGTSSNPYSTNTYKIYARTPGVTDNSAGVASSIEFQVEWNDVHTGLGSATEGVDGTLRVDISVLEAFGTLSPSGSGNFLVTTPTIQITQSPTT